MSSHGRGEEETFWGSWNVLNLDLDGVYMGEHMCKNPSSCALRSVHFTEYKLYIDFFRKDARGFYLH